MYDLSGHLDGISTVEPGTNLLVAGQTGEQSREQVLDILGDGLASGEGAVIVTADQSAAQILEQLEARANFEPNAVAVVDCYSGEETTEHGDTFVYTVPSPAALTSIGVGIVECFRRLSDAGLDRCRVGVISLSPMLAESDEAEIFKFGHVVSSRLDSAGFLGLFAITPARVDSHSYKVITEAFDETVEL